jgi:thioredoxin 1
MTVLDITDATFDEVIGGADLPVLVEFTASWCGPCVTLAPVLDELAEEQADRLVVGKIDIDDNLAVSRRHEVMSAPTLMVFVDGQPRRRMVGARGKRQLLEELAPYLATGAR